MQVDFAVLMDKGILRLFKLTILSVCGMFIFAIPVESQILVGHNEGEGKGNSVHSKKWTKDYDRYFKKYSKRYFGPYFNWLWFKSQGIVESRLKSRAKSHRHARGIMQIMPATFEEIRKKNPHFNNISSPKWNIAAGIYYDRGLYRRLYKNWQHLSENDRLYFMFAGYNAGMGNVMRGLQKEKRKPLQNWHYINKYLPKETRDYVARIRSLMPE